VPSKTWKVLKPVVIAVLWHTEWTRNKEYNINYSHKQLATFKVVPKFVSGSPPMMQNTTSITWCTNMCQHTMNCCYNLLNKDQQDALFSWFISLIILYILVFIMQIYHDAQSTECQMLLKCSLYLQIVSYTTKFDCLLGDSKEKHTMCTVLLWMYWAKTLIPLIHIGYIRLWFRCQTIIVWVCNLIVWPCTNPHLHKNMRSGEWYSLIPNT
jgi:hypothetical protein